MNPLKALRRLGSRLLRPPATKLEPKPEVLRKSDISKPLASEVSPPPRLKKRIPNDRKPYFVQIGLDFGTAFSKCVCRDLNSDKAWVHRPVNYESKELPFLIPCNLALNNGYLSVPYQNNGGYMEGGLPHLKMALQKIALKELEDPVIRPYHELCDVTEVTEFVRACAVYLIAGIIGGVKREIEKHFPGHLQDDYTAVNMALPVAHTDKHDVRTLFQEVLQLAWVLAEKLTDHPKTKVTDVISLISEYESEAAKKEVRKACFLYPEVGANVQGFVRSRVSSPGIYLFSDTGAGTVDQSLFIFKRSDEEEKLTFLYAAVLPLGSSYIEHYALKHAGEELEPKNLEKWRLRKEADEENESLSIARQKIGGKLEPRTKQTIASAKKTLPVKTQINNLKIIFGGGGLCHFPYEKSVLKQFDSDIFPIEEIEKRRSSGDLSPIGMQRPSDLRPTPSDLIREGLKQNWMNRLNVAYGLAFFKKDLARYKLPSEGETPTAETIFKPRAQVLLAPSKDDC